MARICKFIKGARSNNPKRYIIVLTKHEKSYLLKVDLTYIIEHNNLFTWYLKKPKQSNIIALNLYNELCPAPITLPISYFHSVKENKNILNQRDGVRKEGYPFVENESFASLLSKFVNLFLRLIELHKNEGNNNIENVSNPKVVKPIKKDSPLAIKPLRKNTNHSIINGRSQLLNNLGKYYKDNGIAAIHFDCKHYKDCSSGCNVFSTSKEAFVGSEYENGGLPRLLFLSLDSGSGKDNLEEHTLKGNRLRLEGCDIYERKKNTHWFQTNEIALTILSPFYKDKFGGDLELSQVVRYFAHTNSAKCSMNKKGNKQASKILFKNCRKFIPGELELLQPAILITQGMYALKVIEAHYEIVSVKSVNECQISTIQLAGSWK